MDDLNEKKEDLQEIAHVMKRDWDDRAHHDARWFINTFRFQQTEEEFDRSGIIDVERLVLANLSLLTQNRDPKSLRVLDIGCGIGRMTKHLAKVFGEVVGVDVSGEMIRQARERLAGIDNVELYETNGVDLSIFPDESFDLVLSAYVFQHVPSVDIITSNLCEAWRVLRRGGIFKFQTISLTTLDFEEVQKDTWIGASFPESRIRSCVRECDAQLIAIYGAGTRYCWTTVRRRPEQIDNIQVELQSEIRPEIRFCSRADAPEIRKIPVSGDQAAMAILVSGLNSMQHDCNSILIEIGDQLSRAHYVGPINYRFEAALKSEFGELLKTLTQIEASVPIGTQMGSGPVRVIIEDGARSNLVNVEFEAVHPVIPRISAIMNAHDDGAVLFTRGERSKFKILVEGLNDAADTGNIRIQVGERIIKPRRVIFVPNHGLHEIDAQLPDNINPGATEISIYFGNLQSPAMVAEIRS